MNDDLPVLVIGGTHGTGLLIARLLHQRGVPVRVPARDRARTLTLFDRAVDVVSGDLTKPDTLPAAIAGTRHIVFTAKTSRATFEAVWGSGAPPSEYDALFDRLAPDAVHTPFAHPAD